MRAAVAILALLLAACQQGGGEAGFHNDQGIEALAEDRYDAARISFEKALDMNPNDAVVWGNLGVALTRLESYDKALAAYTKAIELDPKEPVTVAEIGSLLYRMGRYPEAEARFREAIGLVKTAPEFHSSLSLALRRQGRIGEADAELGAALDVAEKNWRRHGVVKYHLAASHVLKGEMEQALGAFAESLETYPPGARAAVSDPDFAPLYDNPRFQELVGGWWKRAEP